MHANYIHKFTTLICVVLVIAVLFEGTNTVATHTWDPESPHNGDTKDFGVTVFLPCSTFQGRSGLHATHFWGRYTTGVQNSPPSAKIQTRDGFVNVNFAKEYFCSCNQARQIALQLENVDAVLVGPWCPEEISEVLEDAGILHFVFFYDTMLPYGQYRFQSYYNRSNDFAHLLHQAAFSGISKFGLAYPNHENAINRAMQVSEEIREFSVGKDDMSVVYNETYSQFSNYKKVLETYSAEYRDRFDATSWDAMLLSMKEAGVQYAMFFSYGERVSIMNRIAELGINFQAINFDESGPEMETFLGDKAEFVTSTLDYVKSMNRTDATFGSNENFVKAYEDLLQEEPNAWTAKMTQMIMIIDAAIRRADSINREKLISELLFMELDNFYSPVQFSFVHVMKSTSRVTVQTQKGKLEAVFPSHVASSSIVMPMPPWECRVLLNKLDTSICSDEEFLVWEDCTRTNAYVESTYNSAPCIARQRVNDSTDTYVDEDLGHEKETPWFGITPTIGFGLVIATLLFLGAILFKCVYRRRKGTSEEIVLWIPVDKICFDVETNGSKMCVGAATHGPVFKATFQNHQVVSKVILPDKKTHSLKNFNALDIKANSASQTSGTSSILHGLRSRMSVDERQLFSSTFSVASASKDREYHGLRSNSSTPDISKAVKMQMRYRQMTPPFRALANLQSFDSAKKQFESDMRQMIKWKHGNLLTVFGAYVDEDNNWCMLTEYTAGGSLKDFRDASTTDPGIVSLVKLTIDIADGLLHLHNQLPFVVHGDLSSSHVYIDHHFVAKVGNFCMYEPEARSEYHALWWAPELIVIKVDGELAPLDRSLLIDPSCDVYSFGIVMCELFSKQLPYDSELSSKTVEEVLQGVVYEGLRPQIPTTIPTDIQHLIQDCWNADPSLRPDMKSVRERLTGIHEDQKRESEIQIQIHAQASRENAQLLHQVLPPRVAEKLRTGQKVLPEEYEQATIFFSDIVGFTNISAILEPQEVMSMLDRLYTKFDKACAEFKLFKVETIGDAYMCVGGIPEKQPDQTARVCLFAMAAISAAKSVMVHEEKPELGCVNIRVGMHTGRVIASVVGELNPRYCLFGDTVNTASRMESNSEEGEINLSPESNQCLQQQVPGVKTCTRGVLNIKGKGPLECFFLDQSEENKRLCQRNLVEEKNRPTPIKPRKSVPSADHIFGRWFNK